METAAGYAKGVVSKVSNIEMIFDPLNCERSHDLKWIEPFNSDPQLFEQAKELYNWDLRMQFHTPQMRKLAAGGMLAQVRWIECAWMGRCPVSLLMDIQ
jgi:hypothetical protein